MVNVIGLGYIGLPTALIMAANGVDVVGTDYNSELINTLNNNNITFDEVGLKELYITACQRGISFSPEYEKADIYIVAVPTPYEKDSKKIDCKFVISAVKRILDVCNDEATIVVESTISPGTIDRFVRPVVESSRKKINLAHAPERIIPGNMIYELIHNSRTVGVDNIAIGEKIRDLYSTFCKGEIVITDIKIAEMTKVIENTYRDINIAFANELAVICNREDLDVYEIIKIANKHPRVNILQPGPGVGGHCISVDPWFLVGDYPHEARLIKTARTINDGMPFYVLKRIKEIMKKNNITNFSDVGIYGLTYKENVEDVRESPTLQLIEAMKSEGCTGSLVYDPYVKATITDKQCKSFEEFINAVKMIVIMVSHEEIRKSINKISKKIIFDTRNICKSEDVEKL